MPFFQRGQPDSFLNSGEHENETICQEVRGKLNFSTRSLAGRAKAVPSDPPAAVNNGSLRGLDAAPKRFGALL